MKHIGISMIVVFALFAAGIFFTVQGSHPQEALADSALEALKKGVRFFHSIAIQGGYVHHYTLDLKEKWGEGETDGFTIEVQPPGTPTVGMAYLRAFQTTGDKGALSAAKDAAGALIRGQNDLGGWEHTIRFNRPKSKRVSFDDNQTQCAIRFLMALDQVIDDPELTAAIDKALQMMLTAQFENGAWPHIYPRQGNYHDYATFNDRGINDCIEVMIDAHKYYGGEQYLKSIDKAGRFIIISQLPPPQPGWAQQYNEFLQPAWARSFEPPSVCPVVSLNNINSLIDIFLHTGNKSCLEAVPDALRWINEVRLANGKWPRFVELWTDKPLYYDRGRIRVNSTQELHVERRTGYGYENDLADYLVYTERRFKDIANTGYEKHPGPPSEDDKNKKLRGLQSSIRGIIDGQDDRGRWITKNDRYKKSMPGGVRWSGEYESKARISSAVFVENVQMLCDYLKMCKSH